MTEVPVREDMPYRLCVGIAVFNTEGKVWAGRRIQQSRISNDFCWQLPQGGIDKGEEAFSAAKRELFEETGIRSASLIGEISEWLFYDLPDEALGIALKGKYRGQKQRWFAFRFEGQENEINITNPPDGSHPEFDAWAWKELSEMPERIVPFKREIYDRIVKDFTHLSEQIKA